MQKGIAFKEHIASIISKECPDVTKVQAVYIMEIIFRQVKEVAMTQPVTIRGFGSFKMRTRKERMARNPATGAAVKVPEKTVLVFKPVKEG